MLAAERRSRLLAEVRRRGAAAVPDLAETLGVSEMTIRRDLDVLAADGRVDKVRGGARTPQPGVAASRDFATQSRRNGDGKRAIARRAAELVEPGMSVGLSGGSTTWALARELRGIDDLTIVTNSLPVADVFARPDRADEPYTQTVVLTGGVRTPADALVGRSLSRPSSICTATSSSSVVRGMDLTAGLTTSNLLEAETNRALVAAGGRAVVLADHTKWGAVGLTTIVDLHEVDLVVTDEGLAPDAEETLRAHVTELWVAAHGDD